MTTTYYLKCVHCKKEWEAAPIYKCPSCKGILEVTYRYDRVNLTDHSDELKKMLIYHDGKTSHVLGEGDTATIELTVTSTRLRIDKLFAKCEFCNPTGSFKDRPVSAGMKKAKEFGYKKVVVASSGNGAAAVAAYAARMKMDSLILVPEFTPLEKVKQAQCYGSNVIKVKGPYSRSFDLAVKLTETGDYYNVTTTFFNPYTVEGDKAIAYEIHEQMETWPDYVVVPIGAGPLLVGIYRGFKELNTLFQLNRKLPKMIGVQASGCAPITKAFNENEARVQPELNPQTIASGIADGLDGYPEDGTYTLQVIRDSNGCSVAVDDEEIVFAQKELAETEGLFVEPSAAATLVAIKKLRQTLSFENQSVLLILTGHGLKDMKNIATSDDIPCIEPDVDELMKKL